ncbi:MAG: LysE family translocator [Pseudomonadota bacterium]
MTFKIWTLYTLAVFVLMCTPGPGQILMLSNATGHGFRRALSTAAGDLCVNVLQMLVVGLGLATIITTSDSALVVIKWAGVAYLIWLGVRKIIQLRFGNIVIERAAADASLGQLWMQGVVTSVANPKEIVFFAALFPQFISGSSDFWPQFLILAATYLVLDALFLVAYGLGAVWFSRHFQGAGSNWVEMSGGWFMILAGILLGINPIE